MCVTLIGGMDRLEGEYVSQAKACGHQLKFVSRNERNFLARLGRPDYLIVFTNKVSHEARRKAMDAAKSLGIPIRLVHSCGVSTLRQCLGECLDQDFSRRNSFCFNEAQCDQSLRMKAARKDGNGSR